jgi:integrase
LVSYIVATKGREAEAFAKNLYKSVHLIRTGTGEKVVRPEDILLVVEIECLIESARPKLGLMIKFIARTGCRISEMLNVKLADIKM